MRDNIILEQIPRDIIETIKNKREFHKNEKILK